MSLINRIVSKYKKLRDNYAYRKLARKKGGRIDKETRLEIEGLFEFGNRLIINSEGIDSCKGAHVVVRSGAELIIGDNTGMSQVSINCRNKITIGSNVKIGAGVMIFDTNFHSTDWLERRDWKLDKEKSKNAPVIIGDDVFIGARCIITKGVEVGARTIIAAGAVVVSDLPSDCIAGGNPCKVIRFFKTVDNEKKV